MTTYAIVGPPGTGKTEEVKRQTGRAIEKVGDRGVLITSLTKAAAREAAGRIKIPAEMVGTLHSHCHRTLPDVHIVTKDQIVEFGEEFPRYALSPSVVSDRYKDEDGDQRPGDKLYRQADVLRAQCRPEEIWPSGVLEFNNTWSDWKQANEVMDFTDLIDRAIHELPLPPHGVSVMLNDEAQDFSRLELDLLHRWGKHVDTMVLVGDPDQSMYGFRGAAPDALEVETKPRVLEQSYRVPRAVHAEAVRIIGRCKTGTRFAYKPRDHEGEVLRLGVNYRSAAEVVGYASQQEGTVMLLASCEYMLGPILSELRSRGVPYRNPYSDRWNPLHPKRGLSASQRLLAFLRPGLMGKPWSVADLQAWVPQVVSGGLLERGAKARLKKAPKEGNSAVAAQMLRDMVVPDRLGELLEPTIGWFKDHLTSVATKAMHYPIRVLEEHGLAGLTDPPRICPGTYHSVKGGESDTVIMFPDLSWQGFQQFHTPGWYGEDAIWRQFYVGATRAKQKLVIGVPVTRRRAVDL